MDKHYVVCNGELYHFGVKGMKWGVRKKSYRSTSIRSALARRQNEKVDKSFKNWNDNVQKRDTAIALGKQANQARIAYENDRTSKELKNAYKDVSKRYKKSLASNTTYRKGVVRSEVGKDAARKYLSEAKHVKKLMDSDPSNKSLSKKYNDLMSKHDVERAKARKAANVGAKRSAIKAGYKRKMTMTVKAATAAVAVTAGAYAVNRYLSSHNTTINGRPVSIGAKNIADIGNVVDKVKNLIGILY